MPAVKNKIKLCETDLSNFTIEQIDSIPFYSRYSEMERLFQRIVPTVDFGRCFAQPIENKTKRMIEWYYTPGKESPTRLAEMSSNASDAYTTAVSQRDLVIKAIRNAIATAKPNERNYLNAVLSGIDTTESDNTTYALDGNILFGIWGMKAKPGRRIEDVIRESVLDHRVFTVNYTLKGEGSLSFSSVGRKYGHTLTMTDIPVVTPAEGWKFTKWDPAIPHGQLVDKDLSFTAVCETEKTGDEGSGENGGSTDNKGKDNPDDDTSSKENDSTKYNVVFRGEEGGSLHGCTEYKKSDGEVVSPHEVPSVVPENGYEFIGWDPQPEGHEVHSDVEFVAKFRQKNDSFNIQFVPEEGGSLQGNTTFSKPNGEKIKTDEIPTAIPDDGYEFVGWDHQPEGHEVHSDSKFIARFRKKSDSWWSRFWGWGSGCLNWLLTLLLLGLIGLLLWYLLGNHHLYFCGCDCNCNENTIVIPPNSPDTVTPPPTNPIPIDTHNIVPLPEEPCNSQVESGGDEGIVKPINMGQPSGTFLFEFDTYTYRDRITIYNGKNCTGTPIFQYQGGTEGVVVRRVSFNSPDNYISVVVQGIDHGTSWEFKVNCPQNR